MGNNKNNNNNINNNNNNNNNNELKQFLSAYIFKLNSNF